MTRIETLITQLVQQAPDLDAALLAELTAELTANGTALALSIAQVVELVGNRRVDAGVALPSLAMACGTLTDPRLTEREHDAARFEIETLLPMPEKLVQLSRGRRPPP